MHIHEILREKLQNPSMSDVEAKEYLSRCLVYYYFKDAIDDISVEEHRTEFNWLKIGTNFNGKTLVEVSILSPNR